MKNVDPLLVQRFDDEAIVLVDDILEATGVALVRANGSIPVTLIADALRRSARFEVTMIHAILEKRAQELFAADRKAESDVVAGLAAQIWQRRGDWKDPKEPF